MSKRHDSSPSVSPPLEVTRQIDGLADQFERSIAAGKSPELRRFLHQVEPTWAPVLLRELVAIAREKLADPLAYAEQAADWEREG
ncbi:MAG: hypothetical protein AAGJ46_13110 [Planctomycetota bacterium]